MWDQLDTEQQAARTRQQLYTPPALPKPDPGIFQNFAPTTGNYFMRSLAESGRALSMAAAAAPVVVDAALDTNLSDRYFKWHDDTFQNAVDHWTPKPREAGVAGQVVGQVMGGITQLLINPGLMVATTQMSTAEDLVRQGVEPGAALVAGDIAAIANVIGIRLPAAFGTTLATRMATGAAGNLAVNVPETALKASVLHAAGESKAAAQFDPFDAKARTIDILLGAAFGAKAHWDARLTASDRDAISTKVQAMHIEEASTPGRPASLADLNATVAATRAAMDQMLRGDPVQVDALLDGVRIEDSPAKAAMREELGRVVEENLPEMKPAVETPKMVDVEPAVVPTEGKPVSRVDAILEKYPDLRVADESGEYVPARDLLAKAQEEPRPDFIHAAAACLLGAL